MKKTQNGELRQCVENSVTQYFKDLNGEEPRAVYQMVLNEIEKPLLEVVMKYADKNQSKAAKALGINRSTLRKKLEQHDLTE